MLKHLVLMKFKPGAVEDDISEMEKGLASLPGEIPEIIGWSFGRDLRPDKIFDFALVSDFADFETLGRYRVHPKHVVVLQKVRALCEIIQAVDFEYQT
jgi:hypothetical protein